MSIAELKLDAEELDKLLALSTRIRVKEAIQSAKAQVDKEIVSLELKERLAAERKANAENAHLKRYLAELTEYAWDQSVKFVKIFVTLDGIQSTDDGNVTVNFSDRSLQLHISNVNGKDYGLTVNNLLEPIDVSASYRKVKTGLVAIYMKKKDEGKTWGYLTTIQRRIKEKEENDIKKDMDGPEDALVNIMKKMYKSGDSKTKQMIAKAWTESQEKSRMDMLGGSSPDLDL